MEEKITGLCPHCGKPLEIPGGLDRFSCLYCGARMSPGELLPREIQAPQAAQDAYQRLRLGLPGSVTRYLGGVPPPDQAGIPQALRPIPG